MDTSSQVNVIILESKFELDKESLQKEFMSKANFIERISFSETYFETEQKLFREVSRLLKYFKNILHFLNGSTKEKILTIFVE